MNEKLIEKKLVAEIKKKGGIALKFSSFFMTGFPDRIVLLPGGNIYFVELKTTGAKPKPIQEERIKELRKLGFKALVIDNQKGLNELLIEIDNRKANNAI